MAPGKPAATAFENLRHGTQARIANCAVATGQLSSPTVGDTRTEADFVSHLRTTVATDPAAQWGFIVDQLKTHKSAGLVKWVAEQCRVEEDLGVKGQCGILKDMDSRAAFRQDTQHRIRFVDTPKHCSWRHQIEIGFGIPTRRLLKRGAFASKAELKQRILAFIEYFNGTLAKPCRWTYIGKPLMA